MVSKMENFDHYKPLIQLETKRGIGLDTAVSIVIKEFRLLTTKELNQYPSWPVYVDLITDEMRKNPWVANTKYLGSTHTTSGTKLWVDPNITNIELLWILLHEFRHWIQYHNPVLFSCVNNKNVKLWMSSFKDRDIAEHVLHEIHPAEVDANIYACEKLNLSYPGSKFDITKERLELLELKTD